MLQESAAEDKNKDRFVLTESFSEEQLSAHFWKVMVEKGEMQEMIVIVRNKGVIYGGALRDMVSGQQIKDLDVVISKYYAATFCAELLHLGYQPTINHTNATTQWTKEGKLPIESYVVEDHPDQTSISPESDPDFDVNLLRWDGRSIMRWTDCGSVDDIVTSILHGKAKKIGENVREDRIAKIMARGYTVLQ